MEACKLCDFVSNSVRVLQTHFKSTHLGKDEFQCDFCHFTTKLQFKFREHCILKHKNGEKKRKRSLEIDPKSAKKAKMEEIMLNFIGNLSQIFKCDECNFETEAILGMANHLVKNHIKYQTTKVDKIRRKVPKMKNCFIKIKKLKNEDFPE